MGLRSWLLAQLSRGEPNLDDRPVIVVRVPFPQGPLLIHGLREAGIDAELHENQNPESDAVNFASDILVPRSQLQRATDVLAQLM